MSGDPFLPLSDIPVSDRAEPSGRTSAPQQASLQLYGVWKGNVYKNVRMEKTVRFCDKMIEENNFGSLKWENAEGI